ncbi:MAG: very short patch repair endonuclease [Gammaproteobacteria bacterium]|nr:very short patch repair endonuclease [Gammaproteobacteria bacterium]
MDVVDQATRSRMMSGIKGKDTRPEILIRKGLHRLGFRYRLHGADLPGKPDLVFPKYHAVIFVHGCFWHKHDCHLFKWPSTRKEFWRQKIESNAARDERNVRQLEESGWKVLRIWECSIKGKRRRPIEEVIATAANCLQFEMQSAEVAGIDVQNHELPAAFSSD